MRGVVPVVGFMAPKTFLSTFGMGAHKSSWFHVEMSLEEEMDAIIRAEQTVENASTQSQVAT